MGSKPESQLWQKMKKGTADFPVHWTRLESWAMPGVPDLHGVTKGLAFWIELKVENNKIRPNFKRLMRPHQISWQTIYLRNGGRVWNLVHRPTTSRLQLYEGGWGVMDDDPLPLWDGQDKDWIGLMDHLRSLMDGPMD